MAVGLKIRRKIVRTAFLMLAALIAAPASADVSATFQLTASNVGGIASDNVGGVYYYSSAQNAINHLSSNGNVETIVTEGDLGGLSFQKTDQNIPSWCPSGSTLAIEADGNLYFTAFGATKVYDSPPYQSLC